MSMKKQLTLGAALAMALTTPALAAPKLQLTIQGDVEVAGKEEAEAGDKAFAAGDFRSALAAYGEGFADTKDPDFLYALGQTQKALGNKAEAKSLFESYLAGAGELKYRGEAATEAGVKATKGLVGGVVNTVGGAANAVVGVVGGLASTVYTAVKVNVADKLEAGAQEVAKKGDEAYAAGKYAEARAFYDQAYEKSQQGLALFAEGMANAQAGKGAEARAALAGFLASAPKGEQADQARQMLLAMGGSPQMMAKGVSIASKMAKEAKTEATNADKAFKAGRFMEAAKFYGEAYAKKNDAVALYGKGMAQYAEGDVKEAAESFKSYLASGGKLEFKTQAEAALAASWGAE
ncbi:tetratricopeptide repeat protein [Hyalangium rubrum]|uniref:Tetratricopeptide repeat protein n=1 Tax=Hyalangium rubrum TaxID=3103134 RepID=A0ABU5H6K9_9BACT|nr:tetratricopeptide repeat protein [Hyalangium sp. s54d21]MDY7228729.1 tetratricopeptide repeat protein [Hyalangium sp. s54d21]